jgi:EAL domain-containing protein (putative c-di-GMP-specific phosphodiesterase class I)
VACVRRALDDFALEPQALDLEITEGLVMHNAEQAIATLRELQTVGVGIAIDDFGTGHSSLAYLKRFPLSELKIDRSFIGDIATDPNGPPIVSAIIAMAHRLQLRVVAEGVEKPQQLEFLRGQGCDEAQGFLFGRPVAADAFTLDLALAEHFPQHALRY